MPILHVEIVARPNESLSQERVSELAHRAGEILDSPPGGTWVKVQLIPREHYAENDNALDRLYPIFVSILKAKWPPSRNLEEEVQLLTRVIAEICNRPEENVHLVYLPEGQGRVAFGGRLVSRAP